MAPKPLAVPPDVDISTQRGRRAMRRDAPKRRLCMRFEKGDTYWFVNGRNRLDYQPTTTLAGSGKPPHRIRNTYNFIRPIVESKVSAATQRIPSYEITPTTSDLDAAQAASLATEVALYGYDKWRLRNVSMKVVKLAIAGGGDGFALPYFDPNVGPYRKVGDRYVGQGEVRVLILSGNEVYWEDGVDFMDSRWYCVERARPLEDVQAIPGFRKGLKLTADASSSDIPTDRETSDNLVTVTEYFERPSSKHPEGRCMVWAGGQVIVDYKQLHRDSDDWWGPYPLRDTDGTVLDEPLIHRLSYTVDADTDVDFGLVWQLIDFQRTAQDCVNKLLEWKNRCLNPQMKAPVNSIITPPDDVPGSIRYYRPIGGKEPEWERPPSIPGELFTLLEWTVNAMKQIAADQQIDPAPNLAARTLQASIEQSANRWQSFLGDLAEWHSRLMRHCLILVARHYTEPRLLELRGRDGWQSIPAFRGSHLMGQTKVRVLPQSLAPVTRQGIQEKLSWIAATFPGWLQPEAALAALDGGNIDRLTQSYWLNTARANTVVRRIQDGSVFEMPARTDTLPDGTQVEDVPWYMPGPTDNLNIWKQVVGDFLLTDTFARLKPELQEVGNLVWQGIQFLEEQRAVQAAAQQNAMAEQLGLQNAAKPQPDKGMPSTNGSGVVPAPA